jgi:very-short-patch-repair endonuclease
MKQKYSFRCQKEHQWLTSGESVFRQGTWCPKCKGAAIRNSKLLGDGLRRLQTAAESHGGSCLTTVYSGIGKKYLFRCQKGHEWEACGEPILAKNNGTWCPHCSHSISRPEKELQALVQDLLPDTQFLFNSRQVIPPQELDIYVPCLKKALEFDGDYWHGTSEAQGRDAKKNARCKKKGIQLLRVRESDWKNCRSLVEQQVRNFLSFSS